MTENIPTLDREPNEPEHVWHSRVKKYIRKNAPKDHRYYVRNGHPGATSQRWFVPGLFVLLGLFFAISGHQLGGDTRILNGPNSTQGEFIVEHLQQGYTKRAEDPEFTPVVTIRNQQIVPLFSKPHENTYSVGDTVTLRYSTQGKVVAAFMQDGGKVSNAPSTILTMIGVLFIGCGVLIARYYKGAVDAKYVEDELARLTSK